MNRIRSLLLPATLFLLSLTLPASLAAQITIELKAPASESLEGILLCPDGTSYQVLKADKGSQALPDKSARAERGSLGKGIVGTWKIDRPMPGRYSFFVNDLDGSDEFPGEKSWKASTATVIVQANGVRQEVKPKLLNSGAVPQGRTWHVLDIDGSSGTIDTSNRVFPFRKMIYGQIVDAISGKGVAGVKASLQDRNGKTLEEVTTGNSGTYIVLPPAPGTWKVRFAKEGLISTERSFRYLISEVPVRFDIAVSPKLRADQIRIVLTWGRYPFDLDSHLSGPAGPGSIFHISYRKMREFAGQYFLDRDDMDGYGPETVTLNRPGEGVYRFSVHDYSNGAKPGSGALAGSQAFVTVYKGSEVVFTGPVPEGKGTWWHVLEFDEFAEMKILNTLDDTPLP